MTKDEWNGMDMDARMRYVIKILRRDLIKARLNGRNFDYIDDRAYIKKIMNPDCKPEDIFTIREDGFSIGMMRPDFAMLFDNSFKFLDI